MRRAHRKTEDDNNEPYRRARVIVSIRNVADILAHDGDPSTLDKMIRLNKLAALLESCEPEDVQALLRDAAEDLTDIEEATLLKPTKGEKP